MSIRPLDAAVTVQRAPEINRSQTNEGVRPDILGQHSAETVKKEVQIQDQSVMQTNKTEEKNVNRDGKGNSGYGSGSKKKGGKKEQGHDAPEKRIGMLDVSI